MNDVLEGKLLESAIRRAPRLRLDVAPSALGWRPSFILRGLESLPVALDAA